MKKSVYLPLAFLALGVATPFALSSNRSVNRASALDNLETYIPMEEDSFENYSEDQGSFAPADASFWSEGYKFDALDTFFRGESGTASNKTLVLNTWTQATQYIYFTWGGAPDTVKDEHDVPFNYLKIHCGSSDEHVYSVYNDTFVENPMMLRYFKIPKDDFDELMGTYPDGFDMKIELVDNKPGIDGYAFHNFGYLHINQNEEQVSDAMRYYLNHVEDASGRHDNGQRDWVVNKRKEIYNHYYTNAGLREVFLRTVDNVDEDFESTENFLNHWYIDPVYDNNNVVLYHTHIDKAISNAEVREGTNMPFNKTGNGFFKGWYDGDEIGGYVSSDAPKYRFISRPFVLNEKGIVSIKMAGNSAALHVIDATTRQDLAWADNRAYANGDATAERNIALSGMNTVTMVRHVINLEEFAGQTIQLAIADIFDDQGHPWSAVYFDELKVTYTDYPSFKVDVATQSLDGNTYYIAYPDKYINSTPINEDKDSKDYNPNGLKYVTAPEDKHDLTPLLPAHNFLDGYYSEFRNNGGVGSVCNLDSQKIVQLSHSYQILANSNAAAKAIVDASEDFDRGNPKIIPEEWYSLVITKNYTVGESINALVNGQNSNVRAELQFSLANNGGVLGTVLVIVIVSIVLTVIGAFFIIRKRKNN